MSQLSQRPFDTSAAAQIWANINRELWAITASAARGRGALIATFVNQASIVPEMPRVIIGVARQHHTWQLIQDSQTFALNLLGEEHLDWVWRFGAASGCDHDKLAGLTLTTAVSGCPLLTEALAWLDCRVEAALDSGDRTIFLGGVVAAQVQKDSPPLTVQRMVQLAPPEKLHELRAQFEHDCTADSEAITRWRAQR